MSNIYIQEPPTDGKVRFSPILEYTHSSDIWSVLQNNKRNFLSEEIRKNKTIGYNFTYFGI